MNTNIALIGFMGTGKSTIGKILAAKLNKRFVEIDELIEQKAGKTINTIFQQDGEIVFREMEIAAIKQVSLQDDQIIACGGGVVLNTINIDRLKQNSFLIYLTASPDEILKRTSKNSSRPLLNTIDKTFRIKELLKFRNPLYEKAADITINTTKLNIEAVVQIIIQKLKEDASFNFQE
jgi:shikimate kinase